MDSHTSAGESQSNKTLGDGDLEVLIRFGSARVIYLLGCHSGDLYWRYNDTTRQMDAGYPMRLAMWKGIPGPIDSVLSYKDGKRRE